MDRSGSRTARRSAIVPAQATLSQRSQQRVASSRLLGRELEDDPRRRDRGAMSQALAGRSGSRPTGPAKSATSAIVWHFGGPVNAEYTPTSVPRSRRSQDCCVRRLLLYRSPSGNLGRSGEFLTILLEAGSDTAPPRLAQRRRLERSREGAISTIELMVEMGYSPPP